MAEGHSISREKTPYATLIKKRGAQVGLLTKLRRTVDKFDPLTQSIHVLKGYKENLPSINRAHEMIINELMDHEEADFDKITEDFENFREAYMEVSARVAEMIEDQKNEASDVLQVMISDLDAFAYQLAEFQTFMETCDADCLDVHEIRMRSKHLSPILQRYDAIWHKVSNRVQDASKEQWKTKKKDFSTLFYKITAWFERKIEDLAPSAHPEAPTRSHASGAHHRLPAVSLPTFDGSPDAWVYFRDAFKAIVHNEPSLSGALKFRYLKSSISDKNSPINHLLETDDGYEDAWQAVVDYYEDNRRIVDTHFSGMLSVKYMSAETHDELQRVLNEFSLHLSSLERMHTEDELYRAFVAHLVLRRLDPHTRDLWETENKGNIPYWPDLQRFLKERRKTLSSLPALKTIAKPAGTAATKPSQKPNWKSSNVHAVSNSSDAAPAQKTKGNSSSPKSTKCSMCGDEHRLIACNPFLNLTIPQRIAKIKEWRFCTNCLGAHNASTCISKNRCRSCQKSHHTMLHLDQASNADSSHQVSGHSLQMPTQQLQPTASSFLFNGTSCNTACTSSSVVLLQTAIIKIQDAFGEWHEARAFLDSGSDSNYITKSVATALKLPLVPTHVEANGLGGTRAAVIKHIMCAAIGCASETFEMNFLVTPKVTNPTPPLPIDRKAIGIPSNITLADPTFSVPGKIDILIGNEWYAKLILDGRIFLSSGPVLMNSVFGWLVSGRASSPKAIDASTSSQSFHATTSSVHQMLPLNAESHSVTKAPDAPLTTFDVLQSTSQAHHTTLVDLRNSIEKFYKLEDYRNERRFLTDEETYCEEFFQQTFQRKPTGRFVLTIPLKESINQLSNNYRMALCQFLANEKRLQKNPPLLLSYIKFMREYESLGHMTKIDISCEAPDAHAFYFPHHAVEKKESSTTDVRVVFNGSARTASGLSFNDCQCVGPQIQSDAFTLSLQFRRHPIVIKADIAKMYRQFEIAEFQRKFQRILWRESPNLPLGVYQMNTVTYGTAGASHLVARGLLQLGIENQHQMPLAAEEIITKFYVDDYISGASTVPKAFNVLTQVQKIISSAEMDLRKINSNSKELLKMIPEKDRESPKADTAIKALGIKWDPESDTIGFDVKPIQCTKNTRRTILSEISRIYDPDGLLGPVIFRFKLFLKKIVQMSTPWDKPLDASDAEDWVNIASTFQLLNQVRIPRHFLLVNFTDAQLHGFCDASDLGYGAAIYIRTEDSNGSIMCNLVCAKSRIAPNEYRSTARLELCGIVILANLIKQVTKALDVPFSKKTCWSDSAIALQWLKKHPAQLQIFVANRVSEVQEISSEMSLVWLHISGTLNPADQLSRGIAASDVFDNQLWWHGPEFLQKPESEWPASIVTVDPNEPNFKKELKKIESHVHASSAQQSNPFLELVENSSRTWAIKCKLAPVMRFIYNARARFRNKQRRFGPFASDDHSDAENAFARIFQRHLLPEEFIRCSSGKSIPKNSPIKSLDPIWDSDLHLMRVGGRLNHAQHCDSDQKHPVILPKCHLARLIVRETHQKNLHAGQKTTQSLVRLRYWPIKLMDIVRFEVRKCIRCYRTRPRLTSQFMGQLPTERITPSPPFYHTGVDYCGPFSVKLSQTRNARASKIYVALFVCLSTKAIHLEIVSELTTTAFFTAFDKFTSRRGLPRHMHSDNGLNFVGASNDLQELYKFLKQTTTQDDIRHYLAQNEIQWHFIPPRAPEHGGLWEAGVKSFKQHFYRVASNALLTFEEFDRLKCKIEAVLNSRPLTSLSNDPSDISALTAGHFLIGRPLVAKPDRDFSDRPISRLLRWERIVQMQQHFWQRWSRDYLHQLQIRTKNYKDVVPVTVGQLVLLHIDNLPPMQWPLGRITNIYPGKDGITRVASVRTAKSTYERPVTKLALLPIDIDCQLAAAEDVRD